MSTSADIQTALAALLLAPGALRVEVPVVARREKEIGAEVEASWARSHGLCCYVMPAMPERADELAATVFFPESDVRVRIIEEPARNTSGTDAWQLTEDVANALHWRHPAMLLHPLQIAQRCTEHVTDSRWRIVDVIFRATYELAARAVPAAPLQIAGTGYSGDLQAAVLSQLAVGLEHAVPVRATPGHDLGAAIAASGDPIALHVAPPVPVRAMQGVPFVFFEIYEVRVKIVEQPALNGGPFDAYDLIEDVAATLHWQPFAGLLAHPLQLARSPVRTLHENPDRREFEILFHATCGFEPAQ